VKFKKKTENHLTLSNLSLLWLLIMPTNKIIQFILNNHYPDYAATHKQPIRVLKAIEAQQECQRPERGSSYYRCPEEGEEKEVYHSCRNKGCTICGNSRQEKWLEGQKERLLNCGHFHLVFTIPQEYHPLWLYNRKWFINTHFHVVNETLKDLLMGSTYQGKHYEGRLNGMPGFISTLHTWGRSLNLHPHIHVLITAGGLDREGSWKAVENDFLLPIKLVKSLYRGKFQAKIKAHLLRDEIHLPPHQTKDEQLKQHHDLYKKEWSVRIQEKYKQGTGVLIYLSRYLGSSPIKPDQIKLINHNREVIFSYWSHRDKQQKHQILSIDEFLKKYLLHQNEPRVHTIRYYGIYASQGISKREKSKKILGETKAQKQSLLESIVSNANQVLCPCCGAVMQLISVTINRWKLKNPLYRRRFEIKGRLEDLLSPMPSG
jgi:hypothetical protein